MTKKVSKPAEIRNRSRFSKFYFWIIQAVVTIVAVFLITRQNSSENAQTVVKNDAASKPPIPNNVDFMVQVLQKSGGKNICLPNGNIHGTHIDFESIEAINEKVTKILSRVVKTPFFRKIKIDLNRDCLFWENDDVCTQKECSVEQIDLSNIPSKWKTRADFAPISNSPFQKMASKRVEKVSSKDFAVVYDETDTGPEGMWVDLVDNPEKFTGYAGSSANQIWMTIYQHNCFGVSPYMTSTASGWGDQKTGTDQSQNPFVNPPDKKSALAQFLMDLGEEDSSDYTLKAQVPMEFQMFYNAVSGLHASTSTHICYDHYDKEKNVWSPNLGCFIARIGSFPERLRNIYFNYVLLLRAIQKASPFLQNYDYTLSSSEPSKTKQAIRRLTKLLAPVQDSFDETSMFHSKRTLSLLPEFRTTFQNISRIMDCTGCETCKLWGKTQILGLGTGLKILFSYDKEELSSNFDLVDIKRNEVVALIATFNQFSQSLLDIKHFRSMYQKMLFKYETSGKIEL
ncbi:Endoplasmic reticulum oxidoreductin-1 [Smittium mucronatum]|uniref:Endoplasmic reticulum oxidoreductin-1 n=1 Tax=Smittium mucronatum TaxID=133383 RepID=A0A1R0H4Q2_9FUNG|nr:Endoplasmic reticulum oxidoreductin-1 [Smittium mucronatum]